MSTIHVNGADYPVDGIVGKAKLGDVLDLSRATTGADTIRITPMSINAALGRMGDFLSVGGEVTFDLLEDEELLANLIGLVFLARRVAGEPVTYEEARNTNFDGLKFTFDAEAAEPPKDEAAASADEPSPT